MYQRGDIVIVKFPYTTFDQYKLRPALVLSNEKVHGKGDYILMQITSKLQLDRLTFELNEVHYSDNKPLPLKSYLKLYKVFTINDDLILKKQTRITESTLSSVILKFNELIS